MLAPVSLQHKEICRLDVAVDDALGVSRRQRSSGLLAERDHLAGSQALAAGSRHVLLQRHAAQQFHYQVGPSVLLPGIMDGAYVGMVQRGCGTRLAQKAFMGEVGARMGRTMPRRVVRARCACGEADPLPTPR